MGRWLQASLEKKANSYKIKYRDGSYPRIHGIEADSEEEAIEKYHKIYNNNEDVIAELGVYQPSSNDTTNTSYIKININDIPSKGHMQGLSKLLEVDVPSQTQSKTKAGPINGIYFITVEGPDYEKVTKDIIDACNGVDIKAQLSSEQEYNDAIQSLSK